MGVANGLSSSGYFPLMLVAAENYPIAWQHSY